MVLQAVNNSKGIEPHRFAIRPTARRDGKHQIHSTEAPNVDRPVDCDCNAGSRRYPLAQSTNKQWHAGRFPFPVRRALPLIVPHRLAARAQVSPIGGFASSQSRTRYRIIWCSRVRVMGGSAIERWPRRPRQLPADALPVIVPAATQITSPRAARSPRSRRTPPPRS